MEQTVVTATSGRAQGTRPSRRLRAEGQLPAVVYGLGKDPVPVAVSYTDLRDALKGEAGMNTVINLDVDGKETETVIVRSVQRHPIRRVVTHADFMRIDPKQQVSVKVPIHMVGEAAEVAEAGGLVEQKMFEIEVLVSPLDIPSEIEADVSQMDMDTRVSVGDLNLPSGVSTAVAEDISVVIPVSSRASKMADDAEGEQDGAEATDAGDSADEGGEE